MQEIVEKRSYNAKIFSKGAGKYVMRSHIGHVHYKDENGNFLDSDFTPVDMGSYWEMAKHNYRLRVAKDFGASLLMQYTNRFEGANHTITYEPFAIAWYDPANDDVQIFRNQQSVQAVYKPETNSFYYENAFGAGVDFEITIQRSGFKKEVVIPNKPAQFPSPPTAGHRMVALFKYGGSGLKVRKRNGEEWNKADHIEDDGDGFEIEEVANPNAKSFIIPAYGVDAENRRTSLRVMWRKRNNQLWQIKEIPLDKLQQATFPVRFDTTTNYNVGSGDGWVKNDGSGTWSTVRDGTSGTASDDTGTNVQVYCGKYSSSLYRIYRGFLPIDTSGIPDGATIDSASLFAYVQNFDDNDNDANGFIALTEDTRADHTAVVNADFDAVNHTILSDEHDLTGMSADTWEEFVLNASGLALIDKTGTTQLAVREGHDINDDPVVLDNYTYNFFIFYSSEDATNPPYLEVTYTEPATTVTPSAQVLTFSLPAETVSTGNTQSPATQVATFSIPAYSVGIGKTITPSAQVATFSVPAYVIDAGGNVTTIASVQELTFSLPAETINLGWTASPSAAVATFSTPTPSLALGTGVTVTPAAQVASFSVQTPTIIIVYNVVVAVAAQVLTFSLPSLLKAGAVWTKRARNSSASWSRSPVNDD